jgi:3',5'-cyclic AMP phosphodiesterase CpdA
MTRFLHITDLHVSAPSTEDPGRQTDTVETLARLVDAAGRLAPRPDFIVASGDLTNVGDRASYDLVASITSALDMPVVYALGNHDRRAAFRAAFPGHPGEADAPLDHDAVHGGVHVVVLDSSEPGRVSGSLGEAQFERLAAMLARHRDLPKLVVVHHPPKLRPGPGGGWATLDDGATSRLAAALAGQKVLAMLSGHVHMNRVALWNGIPVVVTMGQQSTVDVTHAGGLRIVEGTGFAICDIWPSGPQVTFASLAEPRVIKEIPEERLRAFS